LDKIERVTKMSRREIAFVLVLLCVIVYAIFRFPELCCPAN
jgi:hypothetical protein